ncbi:polyphenol oxidase [Bacteroidaceae bacterium]|mgnify:FL=1|uniref:peptidoglycan editing factor PgeF n=1 Tax=Prevotella sp. MGM2 TaxID=2033406 RepID=UPI000CEA4533|nr:peptidoglycan editing factor PgeF [Prevotella sp. MGM2]GAY30848.1 polyphenol oxidase [Prevotella sp. MGM2]GFI33839.1 polyphenol oxidase [Bacteroidaceae bacterium]
MNCKETLLEYALGKKLRAFSTTRLGGTGTNQYATFNITPYCGDDAANVLANQTDLCHELGIDEKHLILPHQTHGTRTLQIHEKFFHENDDERTNALEGIDALITDIPGVCIGISTADCVPILLYDEENHAIAAIHAGWRGTAGHISTKTITAMNRAFGTHPERLRAVIGPSISEAAFEVGDEVYDAFVAANFPMSTIAHRCPCNNGGSKWHIDLWAANVLSLEQSGVKLEHIHVSGICTYTHHDTFFSARRLGVDSGRIYSGIMLK